MGLFGGTTDRDELLELQARVARLEEQVARLSASLGVAPDADPVPASGPAPASPPVVPADHAEARALAEAGNKIQAIKVVREQSGMSLKAAKDLVDGW